MLNIGFGPKVFSGSQIRVNYGYDDEKLILNELFTQLMVTRVLPPHTTVNGL